MKEILITMAIGMMAVLILAQMGICGDTYHVELGTTGQLHGSGYDGDGNLYQLNIGREFDHDWIHSELYATGVLADSDLHPGVGWKLRKYHRGFFVEGGFLGLLDGGDIIGLADAYFYCTAGVGYRYKNFTVRLGHISSPLHGGPDGDSGINTLFFGWDF